MLGYVLDRKGSVVAVAYIRGRTRVKGVSNKDVYYVGDVEKDGYIYFGDYMAYRCPTPATQNLETQVNLADVQIWYTVRNCWIRANYFTNLTAYWFDPEDMYDRIEDHERRISDLEDRMDAVEQRLTALEGRVSDLEGRMTRVENRVSNLENRMTQVENRVSSLEERMSRAENNITVLTNALNAAVNRIATLEGQVTVLEAWRANLTRELGDYSSILPSYGSLWDYIQHEVSVLNNYIQSNNARVGGIESSLSNAWGAINTLQQETSSIGVGLNNLVGVLSSLNGSVHGLVNEIATGINFDRTCRTVIDTQVYPILNYLGEKAFTVNGVSSGWLRYKVNECVRTINNLHHTTIQESDVIWENTWNNRTPDWSVN